MCRSLFALFAGVLATACSREAGHESARVELTVYAATSTRDVLLELEPQYERTHAVDLVFNFGSSGDLSKQIVAAAKADVFLSADEREMDVVERAHLIAPGARRALLSNVLVVIEPADGASAFVEPFTVEQLTSPAIRRFSIGNAATVPAGRYAQAWLARVGMWERLSDRVLAGVDVRAALAAVAAGGAQAGIVYRTDAAQSSKVRVVFTVPREEGPAISYPIAVVAGRPRDAEARAFVAFLESNAASTAFEAHGFVPLASSE